MIFLRPSVIGFFVFCLFSGLLWSVMTGHYWFHMADSMIGWALFVAYTFKRDHAPKLIVPKLTLDIYKCRVSTGRSPQLLFSPS
jgi:hypothetical protein